MTEEQTQPRGECVIRTLAMPRDANPNGDIFGGFLVSQMDLGASIAAKRRSKSRTATVAIDKIVFRRPVHVGDTVSCHAKIIKVGNTSMKIRVEIWALSHVNFEEHKVTEGTFTFVAINKHGKPHPVDR